MAELNARQRRHVHMHSNIFSADAPDPRSLYAPGHQKEIYDGIRNTLRENNQRKPPDLVMPTAGDLKCTQMAGHGVVLPAGYPEAVAIASPRLGKQTDRNQVVCDGEVRPVVRSSRQDRHSIPKEFWSTSVNLQWHDTRNERCREQAESKSGGMAADEKYRHEMSSEVLGKDRVYNASTTDAGTELLSQDMDHLLVDSQLHDGAQSASPSPEKARERLQRNLHKSDRNTMNGPKLSDCPELSPGDFADEDPNNKSRRRKEKNFSDMFGAEMGERQENPQRRSDILASSNCYVLDTRSEIAARNRYGLWQDRPDATATDRKRTQCSSKLFDRNTPEAPAIAADAEEIQRRERACWESRDGFQTSTEIARRRRQKDHQGDFEDDHGHTHLTRKLKGMASEQVRLSLGTSPNTTHKSQEDASAASRSVAAGDCSAKEKKLASLQSSIFS